MIGSQAPKLLRQQLEECKEARFHLVGSRFLGTHEPDSDWDYVCTDSHRARKVLTDLGFKRLAVNTLGTPEVGYDEGETPTINVFEAEDWDGVRVQVSLQTDAIYKLKVMKAMRNSPQLRALDKSLRKTPERDELWRALYALAGFDMKAKKANLWAKKHL